MQHATVSRRRGAADGQLLDDSDRCLDAAIFVFLIPVWPQKIAPFFLSPPPAAVSALRGTRANASSPCAFARRRIYRTTVARRARALFESARNVCMADVCLTAPAVLSPLSPNESRKRRHGSSGVQGTWFKRHRTGHGFARRLLHLRGFSIDVRQAEELARFIDQFPPEMEKVRPREIRPSPRGIFET